MDNTKDLLLQPRLCRRSFHCDQPQKCLCQNDLAEIGYLVYESVDCLQQA